MHSGRKKPLEQYSGISKQDVGHVEETRGGEATAPALFPQGGRCASVLVRPRRLNALQSTRWQHKSDVSERRFVAADGLCIFQLHGPLSEPHPTPVVELSGAYPVVCQLSVHCSLSP